MNTQNWNWFEGTKMQERHNAFGVSLVLGNQWWDEWKGKITDVLMQESDVVIRFQWGHNAGHTVTLWDKAFDLHILPSGILSSWKQNIITSGCVLGIDLYKIKLDTIKMTSGELVCDQKLEDIIRKDTHGSIIRVGLVPELESLESGWIDTKKSGLKISGEVIVIGMHNVLLDAFDERSRVEAWLRPIGSTGSGISRAYASEIQRYHFTLNDLIHHPNTFYRSIEALWLGYSHNFPKISTQDLIECAKKEREKIIAYIQNGTIELISNEIEYIQALHTAGHKIVWEWAQAAMISSANSFFGTASNPSLETFCSTTGLSPKHIWNVFLVHKLPPSSVGERPQYLRFEQGEALDTFRKKYKEYGASTGRPRDLWHHPIYESARGAWLNARWIDDESKIVPVYNRVDALEDSLALDNGKIRAALWYQYELQDGLSQKKKHIQVWVYPDTPITQKNLLKNYPERSGQLDLFALSKENVYFVEMKGDFENQVKELLWLYLSALFSWDEEREFLVWTGPKREDLELRVWKPLRTMS